MTTLPALVLWLAVGPVVADEIGGAAKAGEPDGRVLYKRYCADCHHPLEHTNKPDRSARRIRSAIDHLPVMNHLEHLNEEQCRAIAEVAKSRF